MQKQMFSGFSDMRHVIVIFFHFHFLALNIYILLTYYYMFVAASFFPRNCKARKHILRWHGKNTLWTASSLYLQRIFVNFLLVIMNANIKLI